MTPSRPPEGWSFARLTLGVVILTAAQALLVARVGRVPGPPTVLAAVPHETTLVWDRDHRDQAFAGVPRSRLDVFERHPSNPFQAIAAGALPRSEYRLAEWREPVRWLTNPAVLAAVSPVAPPDPGLPMSVARPAVPVPGVKPLVATQTLVGVPGPLASRAWNTPPQLGPWAGAELPGATRIEVAVNPHGWVVLAQVAESSGVKAADDLARQAVQRALFQPLPNAPRRPQPGATNLQWGSVIIHWTSAPPPVR